jgi:hypothetical protein
MFPSAQLNFLSERKHELLAQSCAQRRLLEEECAGLQRRLQWLDRAVITARNVLPWCVMAWPLGRLYFSRREGGGRSWLNKIATARPIARQLLQVWKSFNPHPNTNAP